ncbi:GrpB family protein [Peribacillus frigoritolerans]|uniref:GrpB family protein n=1 Tax=Peribacillus frigoritolerans TaxID=450367 RepID=UPI0020797DEC|nr:GrpB family protein [Peribacillus frigoritolerans]USK74418.1 GrpB family protein [Peribacillus frigoritolerans]
MEKPVVIENYNPNWSKEYEQEKEKIMGVLKENYIYIEHIGSTSVTGLGAKPILDIMVGVNNLDEVDKFIEPLKQIGYEFVSHKEFPERRFFRRGLWGAGTHHLHIYKFGSGHWNNNILFRNYLRTHSDVLKQYHQLKKDLAVKHYLERARYTQAKEPFIQNVLEKAKEEQKNK